MSSRAQRRREEKDKATELAKQNGQTHRVTGVKAKEREALQLAERARFIAEIVLLKARVGEWKMQTHSFMEQLLEQQTAGQRVKLAESFKALDVEATKMAEAHGIPQEAAIDAVTLEWHIPEPVGPPPASAAEGATE